MFTKDELFIIGGGIISLMDNVRKGRASITWNDTASRGMVEAEEELRILLGKVVALQGEAEDREYKELLDKAIALGL